ncbi:MAG: 3,4-dihydroxy-2-butanone-4-phosphate synthase [Alphaproteobacteria bacterium]
MSIVEDLHQFNQISSVEDIIEDAKAGRMFILVDAEDRENEGDLVIPAQMATPDVINFMAKYGRGLICLSLTAERAAELKLEMMARTNNAPLSTAFTVSIEARDGITTGISAADRAHTIATAIDPTKNQNDIVSPGHVFPLVARSGGALVRAGHTETAVDIARLAGLYPAGVICEIMNDDGTMARMPDLVAFAQYHGLKIGTIADVIAYRRKHDSLVRVLAEKRIPDLHGAEFTMKVYQNTVNNQEHIVLVKGDPSAPGPVLVRMHALDVLEDLLDIAADGGRHGLIQRALAILAKEERGVLVLLREPKPDAVSASLSAAANGKGGADHRLTDYGIGAQILLSLGIHEMVLLSNSPLPKIIGLEGYELKVVGHRSID